MVNTCVVPGCSSRSDRDKHLSFHGLPLSNKPLLKQWIHVIGRKNLPINPNIRVCSRHFNKSHGRKIRSDEVPSENLPSLPTRATTSTPRRTIVRHIKPRWLDRNAEGGSEEGSAVEQETGTLTQEVGVNTEDGELNILTKRVAELEEELVKHQHAAFRLENIAEDDAKVLFYTGFPSYAHLKACFDFLGQGATQLQYRDSRRVFEMSNKGRPRKLSPLEEFFLTMVRLRLGLLEQDIAYRFSISQSTVSRIFTTWINFMYLQFKRIPLWPPQEYIRSHMPQVFRQRYPTTRVIIDATEVFIKQPALPELQQLTFSTYKNHNTYKGIIGISPSGAVTFVSKLFPGSTSDKELTRQIGLLNLLQPGDSIMADRGFDIMEDLAPIGVRLNIPPFLRGKSQLDSKELTETRRIASLRIHVERCMERLKNYIFDGVMPLSLMDIADQIFFVCAILTNFHPPLC